MRPRSTTIEADCVDEFIEKSKNVQAPRSNSAPIKKRSQKGLYSHLPDFKKTLTPLKIVKMASIKELDGEDESPCRMPYRNAILNITSPLQLIVKRTSSIESDTRKSPLIKIKE